jgi:hypothetical protein
MPRTGPGDRAGQALLRDHQMPDAWIAREARCDPGTVATMRQRLGLPAAPRTPRGSSNPGALGRAQAELRANPVRTLREIAEAARCTHPTVLRARRQLALCLRQPQHLVLPCQPVIPGKDEFPRGWPRESQAAIRLCNTYCPVLSQCRTWALGQPPGPGVLGGLTQRERQRRVASRAG